jgi:ABC-2 type transport system ATP-binding protein
MTDMIVADRLTRHFGPIVAVAGVSFRVKKGEVLGFLGPNGSGKTTTMRMITGFLPPTSGTAWVCGFDVTVYPIRVKAKIGYMPEGAPSYFDMTTTAYLDFIASIRGLSGAEKRRHIDIAVERAHIREVMDRPIETLSKGYKRRVALAQSILHDPEVLILDEPTEGLDPNQKHEVRSLIREIAAEKAIIISTHLLEEVEPVCSRAIVIAKGRLVADGTPRELLSRSAFYNAVHLTLKRSDAAAAIGALKQIANVADVDRLGDSGELAHIRALPRNRVPILDDVIGALRGKGIPTVEIQVDRGSLDDVFRQVTVGRAA